jgi:hypothetical protein
MNKIAARAFPAFAIGFALFYAPGYAFTGNTSMVSWPLFTYFPAIDQWKWLLVTGNDNSGPPMWWYGWIASAVIVGLVFALISLALPERAIRNVLATLVWIVPICAFIFLLNWELSWFITGWKPIWFS